MRVSSPVPFACIASLLLVGLGCGTLDQPWDNPNHCANQGGDAFCAEQHPDGALPYCSNACPPFSSDGFSSDGCRAQRPSLQCWSPCGAQENALQNDGCGLADTDDSSYPITTSISGDASSTAEPITTDGDVNESTDDGGVEASSSDSQSVVAECTADLDCETLEAPYCAGTTCVPCGSAPDPDAACEHIDPSRPVCVEDRCQPCSDDNPGTCSEDAPVCLEGTCVACTEDDPGACAGETPVCDHHTCVACTAYDLGACTDETPLCDAALGRCIGCSSHDQCPASSPDASGAACNLFTGACLPDDQVAHVDGDVVCPGLGTAEDPYCSIETALSSPDFEGDATLLLHESTSDYAEELTIGEARVVAVLAVAGEHPVWRDAGSALAGPQVDILDDATFLLSGVTLSLNGQSEAVRLAGAAAHLDACRIAQNDGAIVATDSAVVLERCTVDQNGTGIETADSTLSLVRCTLAQNATGVLSVGGHLTMVNTSVSAGNDADAVVVSADATADILYSTLAGQAAIDGNARALVCDETAAVRARNSLFVSAASEDEVQCPSAVITDSAAEMPLAAESNTVLGPRDPSWFVSYGSGDLHLLDPPAALTTAARWLSGDPSTDLDGDPRPHESGTTDYAGADVPAE